MCLSKLFHFVLYKSKHYVSILVLVDVPLEVELIFPDSVLTLVSILVLVDVPLEGRDRYFPYSEKYPVSILVLVDVPLEECNLSV